ncbi:MAG: signal peptide peptidase SppA [Bacteroidota bacterium]|nr:signal peptide peptidase SppA [Bacteroidota bacterium]
MLKFLKSILKSLIVSILSFVIIVSLIMLIAVSSSNSEKEVVVKENSILEITLSNPIVDRSSDFDFNINNIINEDNTIGLNVILKTIEKAKNDDKISGIYLNVQNVNSNTASINEIRNKLQEFKDSTDKFILAYSEVYSQSAYYLASVADKLYLHPEGMIEFKGLFYEGMFFKNAFEKLEIEPQIIRLGKFKSAIEPFVLEQMSAENREQINRFLTSIWGNLRSDISKSRGISEQQLDKLANKLSVRLAKDAIEYNLADGLLFEDQIIDTLNTMTLNDGKGKINKVSFSKYKNAAVKTTKTFSKDKIAVIYAQGEINSGKGSNQTIGSETTSKAIKKARQDDKVKAIVLRVNSPGGSALASETILREMILARATKPVIVSMGGVAASGGYYISCMADTIVANPTTITGSIGVFGIIPNMENMLKNKLGVTVDRVKTNNFADLGSVTRPLSDVERNIIQEKIETIYDTFLTHVSEGRSISKSKADSIGQGRVWTGEDAKMLGLVDQLGGLEDAIDIAAQMAKLENYRITNLPKLKNPLEELVEDFGGQITQKLLKGELGSTYPYYKTLQELDNMEQLQMRMPIYYNIR